MYIHTRTFTDKIEKYVADFENDSEIKVSWNIGFWIGKKRICTMYTLSKIGTYNRLVVS